MKKLGVGVFISILILLVSFTSAATESCNLQVQLLNQDPYPAVPGEYVKLVFQIDGLENPSCDVVSFELLNKYPLILDPNQSSILTINSGTFSKDFASHYLATYKVRVDSLAVDGENMIEVKFAKGDDSSYELQEFNLTVEDTRANFEVYVKDFDSATNDITFEILNIGKSKVEAVTLELLDSENITIKGAKTRIIGDLDSNEYTTANFEVSPAKATIPLAIHYTDKAGIRRITNSSVFFSSDYFADRKADQKKSSSTPWIIGILVVVAIIYFWYKKRSKKKKF